jgi:hypothetical protein
MALACWCFYRYDKSQKQQQVVKNFMQLRASQYDPADFDTYFTPNGTITDVTNKKYTRPEARREFFSLLRPKLNKDSVNIKQQSEDIISASYFVTGFEFEAQFTFRKLLIESMVITNKGTNLRDAAANVLKTK